MLVCGERGYGDGSTPYSWLSNIALLPWLPGFPPQAFPTTNSSLTSTWSIYPQSTAALTLGLLYNPQTPAPSHCAFQETCVPVWGMYGCGKDCLVLIPFKLPQISCFTLSLKRFSSESDNCPDVGTGLLLWFPHPPKAGPIQSNPPVFPASSFILLSVAWSYISFSTGQVLLSTLSWCSACISVSEDVFLMYPWRQMYSTSTYSSTILFSQQGFFFLSNKSSTMKWIGGGWEISMNL